MLSDKYKKCESGYIAQRSKLTNKLILKKYVHINLSTAWKYIYISNRSVGIFYPVIFFTICFIRKIT